MTESEIIVAKNLGLATMLPGSWDKRFAMAMAKHARELSKDPISDNQRKWLFNLGHKYRKQMRAVYVNHVHPNLPDPKPEIDL